MQMKTASFPTLCVASIVPGTAIYLQIVRFRPTPRFPFSSFGPLGQNRWNKLHCKLTHISVYRRQCCCCCCCLMESVLCVPFRSFVAGKETQQVFKTTWIGGAPPMIDPTPSSFIIFSSRFFARFFSCKKKKVDLFTIVSDSCFSSPPEYNIKARQQSGDFPPGRRT